MTILQIFSGASNFVEGVDTAFVLIFGVSFFFLFGITAVMIYFIYKYHKSRNPVATQIEGSNTLEVIWTVIPLIIVLVMFYYGYKGYAVMREVPEDAITVKVISYMWDWDFEYENGKLSKDLYVPLNKAVKLELTSLDVIHSLYIPAFRVKEDAVPGVANYMWFIAQLEGSYDILCAEYCGLRHSYMEAQAIVVPEEEYLAWLADFDPEVKDPKGLEIMRANACMGCHSLDGAKLVGPSFKGIFGSERTVIVDGKTTTVVADEDYMKRAITDPNKEVVAGFQPNLMQSYKKIIAEEDINHIVDYLKTIE
ncbi:MAG: cytochrome c oxidase subunit II [Bacteroidetes bacterium HGW-Bacteroidetes-4]|jgi:cytochrome c oxidase subunit 2|nr:MAG: cytochrome c oxidase subunit II [Bacteroidetes bacterium HGW-Bacteroidetes-4]